MSQSVMKNKIFAADFETTVWSPEVIAQRGEQKRTDVWAYIICELWSDDVKIGNNIAEFMDIILSTERKSDIIYFHNLKFDGSFIIDWLLKHGFKFNRTDKLGHKEFDAAISGMGQWYFIKIRRGHTIVEIRDSLKLLPAALDKLGKDMKTKHQKLTMDYKGHIFPYEEIKPEEMKYIRNDGLVLKEALEMMLGEGHTQLTIGACCLSEFKHQYHKDHYARLFPNLMEVELITPTGNMTAWEYIKLGYMGGWCYVNERYQQQKVGIGQVYDANSHYPSQMHSKSGNQYPIGLPEYRNGKPIYNDDIYYYIRVKCRFELRENAFPWLHIRNGLYNPNEALNNSDVIVEGCRCRYYKNIEGLVEEAKPILVFSKTDWLLFKDTYYIYDIEYIDSLSFRQSIGLFDKYIDKYFESKKVSKGFRRMLDKLFLNNLYGKFAMSTDSTYSRPYLIDNVVHFERVEEHNKVPGYIAIGAAITAYARSYTVRLAMANKDNFCYADTDSVHLKGTDKPAMLIEDDKELCCWKQENIFEDAFFVRQKTYIEKVIIADRERLKEPFYNVRASGMGKGAKQLLLEQMDDISDFNIGLILPRANLKAKRIEGGILLKEQDFSIK